MTGPAAREHGGVRGLPEVISGKRALRGDGGGFDRGLHRIRLGMAEMVLPPDGGSGGEVLSRAATVMASIGSPEAKGPRDGSRDGKAAVGIMGIQTEPDAKARRRSLRMASERSRQK